MFDVITKLDLERSKEYWEVLLKCIISTISFLKKSKMVKMSGS
jgi:hypothetical protein